MTEAIRQGDIPGVQLRCRRDIDLPAAELWEYLAEPAQLERWVCRRARVDDAASTWEGALDLEGEVVEEVRVLSEEAPRRLLATLNQPGWTAATRLEFEITPKQEGSELSILQNGFEHLPLSHSLTTWEAYRRRWRAALERLASAAS